jgi:hypothetical protein
MPILIYEVATILIFLSVYKSLLLVKISDFSTLKVVSTNA